MVVIACPHIITIHSWEHLTCRVRVADPVKMHVSALVWTIEDQLMFPIKSFWVTTVTPYKEGFVRYRSLSHPIEPALMRMRTCHSTVPQWSFTPVGGEVWSSAFPVVLLRYCTVSGGDRGSAIVATLYSVPPYLVYIEDRIVLRSLVYL